MAGIPLESLVSEARTAANMQVGGPWEPDEWDAAINKAVTAFYVDCAAVNNAWRVTPLPFSVTAQATPYTTLPADFANVFKVTKDPYSSNRTPVYRSGDERPCERTYRVEGTKLWLDPLELAVGDYELRYNPLPVILTPVVNLDVELAPHREYFELHAAIKALVSEESSPTALMALFKVCQQRAQTWAQGQRSSDPARPRDVRPRRGLFPRGIL